MRNPRCGPTCRTQSKQVNHSLCFDCNRQETVEALKLLCDEKQQKIEQLMIELVEARNFIMEDYNKFYPHHPYCHSLRKRFPWLDPETPWINI